MAPYVRKNPVRPRRIVRPRKESNDPHSVHVKSKFDCFTAPSVRRIFEDTMRGVIHKDWTKYAKEWLSRHNFSTDIDQTQGTVSDALCFLMEACDKDVKWAKKNELTQDDKDSTLEKYTQAFNEYKQSFTAKAVNSLSMIHSARKQAQKMEQGLSKTMSIIKDAVSNYSEETTKSIETKNEEIDRIELCIIRGMKAMAFKYNTMKVFDINTHLDLMKKSGKFRDMEMDAATYNLFKYAEKTLSQKKKAIIGR